MNMLRARLYDYELKRKENENLENSKSKLDGVIKLDHMYYTLTKW